MGHARQLRVIYVCLLCPLCFQNQAVELDLALTIIRYFITVFSSAQRYFYGISPYIYSSSYSLMAVDSLPIKTSNLSKV